MSEYYKNAILGRIMSLRYEDGAAWSSPSAAMEFAFTLASIRLNSAPDGSTMLSREDRNERSPKKSAEKRLGAVLDLVEKSGPVLFATLWKYRSRSRKISAVARSKSYNPSVRNNPSEFVCSPDNTHAKLILDQAKPIPNCENYRWLRYWYHDDISELDEDKLWNTKELIAVGPDPSIGKMPLSRQLAIVFTGCSGRANDDESKEVTYSDVDADYILNIYFRSDANFETINIEKNELFRRYIKAISNKLASGVCALIEERKTLITEKMTQRKDQLFRGNVRSVLAESLNNVLPDFINVQHSYLFLRNGNGVIELSLNDVFGKREKRRKLDKNEASILENIIIKECDFQSDNMKFPDIAMLSLPDNHPLNSKFNKFQNLLVAKLTSRSDPDHASGYLVLANRINDLAFIRSSGEEEVLEGFDWEDEEYIHHISGIVDFILGIVTADEQKLRQAAYLGHEMKSPAQFVYETADRLKRDLDPRERSPYHLGGIAMKAREVDDILDTAEFVERIADSIATAGDDPSAPRASRYSPERVNLLNIARDMARISLPLCKKYYLDHRKINIQPDLPNLWMDESAVNRVFMNLIMNAAKYAKHNDSDKFKVVVSSEILPIDVLLHTELIPNVDDFCNRMAKLGVLEGCLIKVSDWGIGIVGEDPQRVFEAGHREFGHVPAGVFGAGLGLHFVRKIITDHFGDVWVSNRRNPTEFSIFLPDVLFSRNYEDLPEWKGAQHG